MNHAPSPRGAPATGSAGPGLGPIALVILAAMALAVGPILPVGAAALAYIVGLAALGLLAVGLARSLLQALDESARRAEAILPALERIARALEAAPHASHEPAPPPPPDPLDALRDEIAQGRWDAARDRVVALAAERPDDPEAARAAAAFGQARDAAERDLRARLDASRSANDPDAVLDYHRQLALLLDADTLRDLERDLIRWLLALLMRRMRTGTVRADVASLAELIAGRFPATPEGASLRASLPTLRRSAGLCPRCARPYQGLDDACPECLAPASPEPPADEPPKILSLHDDDPDDPDDEGVLAPADDIFEIDSDGSDSDQNQSIEFQ